MWRRMSQTCWPGRKCGAGRRRRSAEVSIAFRAFGSSRCRISISKKFKFRKVTRSIIRLLRPDNRHFSIRNDGGKWPAIKNVLRVNNEQYNQNRIALWASIVAVAAVRILESYLTIIVFCHKVSPLQFVYYAGQINYLTI